MRKMFLLAALVSMGIIGCTNDEQGGASKFDGGAKALIKVDLKAAGTITKAAGDNFVDGTDAENLVKSVKFYFYDAAGNAYTVGKNPVQGNGIEFYPEASNKSIEEVSDVVLVIKQSEVAPPAKVIAIINENSSAAITGLSLDAAAKKLVTTLKDENDAFTMSNSVYVDENKVLIKAVEILPENIFTTNDEKFDDVNAGQAIPNGAITKPATIKPIEINVERVAAKVKVTLAEDGMYDTGEVFNKATTIPGSTETVKIYAKVLGWNITNNTSAARLIKDIDPAGTTLFTPWNTPAFKRSYWTKMDASVKPVHGYTFENLIGANMTTPYNYYFENVLPAAENNSVYSVDGTNQTPQLLVAAQLVDEDGDVLALGQWFGVTYTLDGLKTAMVNTLASKLFVKEGDEYVSVNVEDVDFVQAPVVDDVNRYEVSMVAKSGVDYYTPASIAQTTPAPISVADAKAIFDEIQVAKMWNTGYTYYFTNINHFGNATGMVRNHCYDITIDAITKLGTPVYDSKKIIVPEKPDPQDALNLAAKINILSWSLVNQNVSLGM